MKESFKQYISDLLKDISIEDIFHEEEIFTYIKENFLPEDIFDEQDLRGWADRFYGQ